MSDDPESPKPQPDPPPEPPDPATAPQQLPAAAMAPPPNQTQTAPCPLCQHPITFTLPMGTPFRHPEGTILFFPHSRPIRCSECGQHYTPFLLGVQGVAWNWQPCPPPSETPRITLARGPLGPIPFQRRKPS